MLGKFWLLILAQQSPDWALSWTAPAECSQVEAVSRSVEQRLGHPVFGAPPRYRIEGRVEKMGTGYHGELTLKDAGGTVLGTREVSTDDASCSSLDARVTLVLALMISPSGALGPGPIAAPPAAAPPMLPPPLPPGPLLRRDENVRVHLDSDQPHVQLISLMANTGPGITYVATTVLCEAPCDKPVKATARLFIGGDGVMPSDEFSLAGMSAATVRVKLGSMGRRWGGLLTATMGTAALVGGLLMILLGGLSSSSSQGTFTVVGASLGGGGALAIVGGILLMQGTGTTVTVTQTF